MSRKDGTDARPPPPPRIGLLEVPVAGLGTNNFGRRIDEAGSREVATAALKAGVTFFDTARHLAADWRRET